MTALEDWKKEESERRPLKFCGDCEYDSFENIKGYKLKNGSFYKNGNDNGKRKYLYELGLLRKIDCDNCGKDMEWKKELNRKNLLKMAGFAYKLILSSKI